MASPTITQSQQLESSNSMIPTSVKRYFVIDALVSEKFKNEIDNKPYFAITGIYDLSTQIASNAEVIMVKPSIVCSTYDKSICHNLSEFYKSSHPSFLISGFYKADKNNTFSFGINSGFNSQKLDIAPSFLVGGATRLYTSEKKDSHFIFESNYWIGTKVRHSPCLDSYDRKFYCGNLTAWSDFKYDARPKSYNFLVWYEKLF